MLVEPMRHSLPVCTYAVPGMYTSIYRWSMRQRKVHFGSIPREKAQPGILFAERVGRGRGDTAKLQGGCGDVPWPKCLEKLRPHQVKAILQQEHSGWIVDFCFGAEWAQRAKHLLADYQVRIRTKVRRSVLEQPATPTRTQYGVHAVLEEL